MFTYFYYILLHFISSAGGLGAFLGRVHDERAARPLSLRVLVDELPELPNRAPFVPVHASIPLPTAVAAHQGTLREAWPEV